jgi:hypothetical protein
MDEETFRDLQAQSNAERLELDRQRLRHELRQTRWTAVAVFVPLAIALGSIAMTLKTIANQSELQARQATDQFQMTAANIVVNNNDPDLAYSKALALQQLFPERLPRQWVERFNPKHYCLPVFEDRMIFARLAIEHPDQRQALNALWQQMYCNQAGTDFSRWLELGMERSRRVR